MKFVEMPKELQTKSIETLSLNYGMPEQIIEKDWWVSAVMRALFALPYANQMSFKGGTSLSKCWGLIDRFSEDIDIAVAREFPGYGGELSRTQISDKLRRASCYFVREKLQFDIRA
ncbi:MAG: nucleotidyl transferase AbiEii/AbiGii toxin family protein [Candidatus Cryptobacteroides sp.]